jgi:hypothetical protein
MRFDRFKAEILQVHDNTPVIGLEILNTNRKRISRIFEFSKNRIFFTDEQKSVPLSLEPPSTVHSTSSFKDGMRYKFDKVYDDKDKRRFQISVGNTPYSSYLKIDRRNRIICNIIHNRYWLLNERQWFITFLLSLAAIVISIIALTIKCK